MHSSNSSRLPSGPVYIATAAKAQQRKRRFIPVPPAMPTEDPLEGFRSRFQHECRSRGVGAVDLNRLALAMLD